MYSRVQILLLGVQTLLLSVQVLLLRVQAPICVADANLPAETLRYLVQASTLKMGICTLNMGGYLYT